MATLTWIGGQSLHTDINDATDPLNWVGGLQPQNPGDVVIVPAGSLGAAVTLDLVGTLGSPQSVDGATINVAGPFDNLLFSGVTGSSATINAGNGAAAGQGTRVSLVDSIFDASSLVMGSNGTIALRGSAAGVMKLTSTAGQSQIRATGTNLVVNTVGTASVDAMFWATTPDGQLTLNIAEDPAVQVVQSGTTTNAGGFYEHSGALLNIGGTVTINGDSNVNTRFSNTGFVLVEGTGTHAAAMRLNARVNGTSGVIDLIGGTPGATLDVNTNMPGAAVIAFGDATGRLKIESNTTLASPFNVSGTITTVLQNFFSRIEGFRNGNTIALVGLNPAGLTYSYGNDATYGNDVLIINRGTSTVARLRFVGNALVAGTGTVDNAGATTGNFELTSSGGDTLVTLTNTRNAISGASTVAVDGQFATWNAFAFDGDPALDWNSANWLQGTGAAGLPGQYQAAEITLTGAETAVVQSGTQPAYVINVATAATAGALNLADPFATLRVTAPLTLAAVPGGNGGSLINLNGRIDIQSGGTVTTSRVYQGTGGHLAMSAGSALNISGNASFTLGAGVAGIDVENSAQVNGGTVNNAGNTVVGQNSSGNLDVSNNIVGQSGTLRTYGTIGAHYTTTYTQVGGNVLAATGAPTASLTIAGAQTVYTDAGGDATSPFSGALIVGGGNISANGLGQITLPAGGNGFVAVMEGATLVDTGFAMLGATRGSSGTVDISGGSVWRVGSNVTPQIGSIVVGNTITTQQTLFSSNLPMLAVGSGGTGTLNINTGTVQLGSAGTFNTFQMMIGVGNTTNVAASGMVVVSNGLLDTGGGPLAVAHRSPGTLTIGNAGTVHVGANTGTTELLAGLMIGNRSGSVGNFTGVVNVNSGGVLIDDGDLVVGRDSSGTLSLQSGASATIGGQLFMGGFRSINNGTTTIPQTLVRGASVATTNLLRVNGGGSLAVTGTIADMWQGSTLSLLGSSQITIGGASPVAGDLVIAAGATLQGAGLIEVLSTPSTLLNFGTVLAGGLTSNGSPSQVGALLDINASVGGSGVFKIAPSGKLQFDWGNTIAPNVDFGIGNLGTAPAAQEMLNLLHPLAFAGTISNFYGLGAANNRVDLLNAGFIGGNPASYAPNVDPTTGGIVSVVTQIGTVSLRVTGYHPSGFTATLDGGGTGTVVFANDAVACFTAGTRLLTATGERPVEALRAGDLLPAALGGRLRRVLWVGRTVVDLDRHPEAWRVAPIRVAAGAFGPGRPLRDLVVSPDHALWTGDALVPAHLLVNGATITREPARGEVTYLHVELDAHDLVLAEGLAAESYLDTGNRAQFAGEAGARPMLLDLLADADARAWDTRACAPLALGGAPVANARAALWREARALGFDRSDDADVVLLADGAIVPVIETAPGLLRATLPAGTRRLTLRSRSVVPADLDPAAGDRRRLGLALLGLSLNGAPLALAGAGFHDQEAEAWRWTDGAARIALPAPLAEATDLLITFEPGAATYPVAPAAAAQLGSRSL